MRPNTSLALALAGLATFAPTPDAQAGTVPEIARRLPAVQVRDCHHSPREERVYNGYGYGSARGSGGGVRTRGTAAAPPPPATPTPTPDAVAESAADAPAPIRYKERTEVSFEGVDVQGEMVKPSGALLMDVGADLRKRAEAIPDDHDGLVRESPIFAPPRPTADWGGTVHLSNDDTLSLASAQRVLWAAKDGSRIPLEHVRPHELLNYFTFDTQAPTDGSTFALQPSAVIGPDGQMTLAVGVAAAAPRRDAIDLTWVVDRSGSMSSDGRMTFTKRALNLAADQLRPGEVVNLVLFDHEVCTPLEHFVVGRDDPRLLRDAIARLQPRGSTNLHAGLSEGYRIATDHARHQPHDGRVMMFTDANLNRGVVDPHQVAMIGEALDQHGIRLTGVGVGRGFRDDVLDELTEAGRGAYVFLGSDAVVDRLFGPGFDALVNVVAEDVRFALHLPDSLGMKKFYGEEASRDPSKVKPVHAHAGSSQLFLQDLAVRPGHLQGRDVVRFEATWTDPDTGHARRQTASFTVDQALRADPHDVHKGKALMAWTDVLMAQAMGADTCEGQYAFSTEASHVPDDAELRYVASLFPGTCSEPPISHHHPVRGDRARVRVDADVDITAVAMTCGGRHDEVHLASGDNIAELQAAPGTCDVILYGPVPMVARVDLPHADTDLRCVARGGRLACR